MNEFLFSMYTLGSYKNPEYFNLTKEEKDNLDFMDKCINNEDKRISDASFNIMLLLIEISNEPDKYEPEEIQERRDKIVEGLSEKEVVIMDKFLLSCINSMGVYSDEAITERRLRKERND